MAQFNKVVEKIKKIKNIEVIIAIVLCLVVLVIFVISMTQDDVQTTSMTFEQYNHGMVSRLEQVISEIDGIKSAKVEIQYSCGVEKEYAYNTTTAVNGDIITQIVLQQGEPILVKEIAPKVNGVVVVVNGTTSAVVKMHIKQIITTLLNIDSSRIEVFAYAN